MHLLPRHLMCRPVWPAVLARLARFQTTGGPSMAQTTEPAAADTRSRPEPDPELISGGHLVARAPQAQGGQVIFTLCGGHIIDIYDGCVDEGIAIVDVRHEQVAAHAADGWARVTGGAGCAVGTGGPGTTDAGDG